MFAVRDELKGSFVDLRDFPTDREAETCPFVGVFGCVERHEYFFSITWRDRRSIVFHLKDHSIIFALDFQPNVPTFGVQCASAISNIAGTSCQLFHSWSPSFCRTGCAPWYWQICPIAATTLSVA